MTIYDYIRRGQLIVPFGVGAMIDLPEETIMTAGLDNWPVEFHPDHEIRMNVENDTKIVDDRLRNRLRKLLKNEALEYFYSPTQAKKPGEIDVPLSRVPMNFFRFPSWLFCPRCKVMKKFPLDYGDIPKCDSDTRLKEGAGKKCSELRPFQRQVMKPVRFVLVCKKGHIDDFPWDKWVHRNKDDCDGSSGDIYFNSTARSGLDGVLVSCRKCGKVNSMSNAFGKDKNNSQNLIQQYLPNGKCRGRTPWLGPNSEFENCDYDNGDGEAKVSLRATSSIYFPNVVSSILIPPYSKSIWKYFRNTVFWESIVDVLEDGLTTIDGKDVISDQYKKTLIRHADRGGFDHNLFIENAIEKWKHNKGSNEEEIDDIDEEKFRFKEYLAFSASQRPPENDRSDFDIVPCNINEYKPWVAKYFSRLVKVEQIRETRAFVGFSRILPVDPGKEKVKLSAKNLNWLPASIVKGEGIFFEFNINTIRSWEHTYAEIGRGKELQEHINNVKAEGSPNFARRDKVDDRFILVHTFAHAFIRQLSFECGYEASSLKERIYVGKDDDFEMCGLLIYTASGDSEGSLGGLLQRTKVGLLENSISQAVLEQNYCSQDPVCLETEKQGIEGLNASACYACCLLPETSCENSNLLLDRKTIIGSMEKPEFGFFKDLINMEL